MTCEAPALTPQTCRWCGQPRQCEILEAWGHEVMFETCCEAEHEALLTRLADDPDGAAGILRHMDAEQLLGWRLRGLLADGPGLALDYRLRIAPIRFGRARDFVMRHHEHCRPPAGWRFGAGCWNGPTLVGVAMVGRPVARMIDAKATVEVNRLCLDRSLPAGLRRNAVSMLLGHAAREARRRGFSRIITYTLESESGSSLRASGWSEDGRSRGGSWSRPARARGVSGPTEPKVRWARELAVRRISP